MKEINILEKQKKKKAKCTKRIRVSGSYKREKNFIS